MCEASLSQTRTEENSSGMPFGVLFSLASFLSFSLSFAALSAVAAAVEHERASCSNVAAALIT